MWALLPGKSTASGFTDQVFLILARFTSSSLPALFQGFWILTSYLPWAHGAITPDVDFWDLLAKISPLVFSALFQGFWILTLISTLGSWGYPPVVGFWDLSAKMRAFFVFFAVGLPQSLHLMQAFILSPYSWKAYGIRLNLPGLCNIGKIFNRLPWLAFVLGFSTLFTLGIVCPHLWTFRTCGNTICGAFVFPPDKLMHCMILG
jgi:hypothetical protein